MHIEGQHVVTVRPAQAVDTVQGLPAFVGISAATAGATGIGMNVVEIPPGAAAEPHFHNGFETAIYLLSGRVETRFGEGLANTVVNEAATSCTYRPAYLISPET